MVSFFEYRSCTSCERSFTEDDVVMFTVVKYRH